MQSRLLRTSAVEAEDSGGLKKTQQQQMEDLSDPNLEIRGFELYGPYPLLGEQRGGSEDLSGSQVGGRLLGQGAYGCIFTPPLICTKGQGPLNPKRPRNKLGKMSLALDMSREIMASEHFKDVPEAIRYMILPDLSSLCKPAPLKVQREKDFKGCEPLQRFGFQEMYHYEMTYGGKAFDQIVSEDRKKQGDFYKSFWHILTHLLEIGAFLLLHGFVHNDFHGNNIVIDKQNIPRLVDFGRSYSVKSINNDLIEELRAGFQPSLGQIPPETSLQDALASGMSLEKALLRIKREKPGLVNAERYLGISREKQIEEFKRFWRSSRAVQQEDWVKFWKLYWPVVDSWSIGHRMMQTYIHLRHSREFMESPEWKERGSIVRAIMAGLLKASPRTRLDAVEALALYDPGNAIVNSPAGQAWLTQKEEQRAKQKATEA